MIWCKSMIHFCLVLNQNTNYIILQLLNNMNTRIPLLFSHQLSLYKQLNCGQIRFYHLVTVLNIQTISFFFLFRSPSSPTDVQPSSPSLVSWFASFLDWSSELRIVKYNAAKTPWKCFYRSLEEFRYWSWYRVLIELK